MLDYLDIQHSKITALNITPGHANFFEVNGVCLY